MKLPGLPAYADVRDALARGYLEHFLKQAWPHFESNPYETGKHINVMAGRLEAITRGETRRLLVNLPRRHSKSDLMSVAWPAWTWLQGDQGWPLGGPGVKFIVASHSHELAMELSRKCRMLVESDWYQELARGTVKIRDDANAVNAWQLTAGGGRRAFSIDSRQTGFGADVFLIDDPHDIREVESAVSRESVRIFFQELVPGQINDPKTAARVVVAQRTHAKDLSAIVLEGRDRYEHLCLPGLYDPEHPYLSGHDWRSRPGAPLWEGRFSEQAYDDLAGTAYAKAAQVQQNPQQRGAGLFARAQWQFSDDYPRSIRLTRWWDKAATAEGMSSDPDYTAGVLGGFDQMGLFWLVDVIRGRWSSNEVQQRIDLTARQIDGRSVAIYIEEEGGSSGKDVTALYQRLLRGFAVRADRPTGQKVVRVDPFLAAAEAGNVVLVNRRYVGNGQALSGDRATWQTAFLAEADEFTGDDATHDDQIIAAAGCFNRSASVGTVTAGRMLGV